MSDVRLIVLRGNSGSGKTSVSLALQRAYGRGVAWVSQDMMRRQVLRELDHPGARNVGLIDLAVRYALESGYHVVLDGILRAARYEDMLAGLRRDHPGPSHFYYLDVSLAETLLRHETRPQRTEFSSADMLAWYQPTDLLASIPERVIAEDSSLDATVATILAETDLLAAVQLRADVAAQRDLPSWLELAAEVEPVFGPVPGFADHARRAVGRGTALVVRDRDDTVLGAVLLSHRAAERRIHWLAVRAQARRRGVAAVLLTAVLDRWPALGDIDVVTFGPDVRAGQPARSLYESFGFQPADVLPPGPEGGSRQRFILRRPGRDAGG